HEEGRRAHDGRHELAAGGGRGLDSAGKLRLVAELFHHRYGEGAAADGVGDGGAGHRALEGGGDDGDLGRTADALARYGVGEVYEQLADAGLLKEGAEQYEQEYVCGGDAYGRAEHALGGEEHEVGRAVEADLPVRKQTALRQHV